MLGHVSETVEVSNPEASVDSVLLSIGKLVKDRAEIRHHEVTRHLTADKGISFILRLRIKHIEH